MSTLGYCFVKPNGKYLVRYQYHHHHKLYWAWRDTTDIAEATVFPSMNLPRNAKKEKGYPRGSSHKWEPVSVYRRVVTFVDKEPE